MFSLNITLKTPHRTIDYKSTLGTPEAQQLARSFSLYVSISQRSVIINDSLYTICLLFNSGIHCMLWWEDSRAFITRNKNSAVLSAMSGLNISDWPLHSRNQQICLWFATLISAVKTTFMYRIAFAIDLLGTPDLNYIPFFTKGWEMVMYN